MREMAPTPEDAPFPIQTSLYAASKVAGEGLISAYASGFGFQAFIFRFVSILGERYTHGHVFDFYAKLRANPHVIEVLGNGKQRKSYLYVQDCVTAILTVIAKATDPVNVVNLGADEYCQVDDSLGWICDRLGLNPKRQYAGGARGWRRRFLDRDDAGRFPGQARQEIRAQRRDDEEHGKAQRACLREQQPELAQHGLSRRGSLSLEL